MRALAETPVVPCATLLVRILPAALSSEGEPLSITDIPAGVAVPQHIDVPAPPYALGQYVSTSCVPSKEEALLYTQLLDRKPLKVRDCLPLVRYAVGCWLLVVGCWLLVVGSS